MELIVSRPISLTMYGNREYAFSGNCFLTALKAMIKRKYLSIVWMALLIILVNNILVIGQQGDYFQYAKDGRKGYWRVKTDPLTRSTEVNFYNQQGDLLYKEVLKNKYLKLNHRNTQILNNHLARLIDHTLVASEVKSTQLLASSNRIVSGEMIESTSLGRAIKPHAAGHLSTTLQYSIHTIRKTTSLVLILENPAQEKLIIKIKDHKGRILYTEQTALDRYRREIHLNQLKEGSYSLVVFTKGQKLIQKFDIGIDEHIKQIFLLPQK